jgi:type I restriction enzyme S subunit
MSEIEMLIDGLLPNGVKVIQLSEIADTFTGLSGKTKVDFGAGNSRYVTYMNVFSNLAIKFDQIETVNVRPNEKQNTLRLGDVIFTSSSEAAAEVGMSSVVTEEPDFPLYLNSFCFGLRFRETELFDPSYLKHLFRSNQIRDQIVLTANGVTRYNVSKSRFMKLRIPIPELEVQSKIGRTLDAFKSLEAELEAELTSRRKQYAFYRDQLLNFRKA